MAFALRCPDCRKAFKWQPDEPMPRFCPLCQTDMGEPPDDNVICLPAFLSANSKATDKVGRDLMDSSNARTEHAAAMAGCSPSEMAAMKVTDLAPTRHEGSIAAMPVQNAVTQQMDMLTARGGQVGFAGPNAMEYSSAVQTGPHPNAGARMRAMVHQANGAVSDRPALETLQPGYRNRA